jgi:predicted metal-dependent hydrolase
MSEIIQVDDLHIEVRRSHRRRTVDLTVDRFGQLVIAVPGSLNRVEVERIIRKKQLWIYKTMDRKREALHSRVQKEYVTGEGFYYLGKKYRLKVFDGHEHSDAAALCLKNGRFMLRRDAVESGKEHFVQWYIQRGRQWVVKAVDRLKERVATVPKSVGIRDLKFRWGSCTSKGDVYFHWRVMLLPPTVIHYLILHELVHLHEHHHGPKFYERLERAVPDFMDVEAWLEKNGDRYAL